MGMYTELNFGAQLKQELPEGLSDWLERHADGRVITDSPEPFGPDAAHPFFQTPRWYHLFWCSSAYFTTRGNSEFNKWTGQSYDHPTLFIHTSLKNYDDEIGKFIDWIAPYVDDYTGTMVGYHRYEENQLPTLIFVDGECRDDGRPDARTLITREITVEDY